MARPLFQLGARLTACAGFVRPGAVMADIGTDHAYLPIWLLKSGRIPYAYASDVKRMPLESAKRNAEKYQVGDRLCTVLGNGLENISDDRVTDVVIAGMGGALIADILRAAPFVRNQKIRLILQPMKDDPQLRLWLFENGFVIEEEKPVFDAGKVYTVICAAFSAVDRPEPDVLYPYMGRLPKDSDSKRYAEKVVRILAKEAAGAEKTGDMDRAKATTETIRKIRLRYIKEEVCPE